MLDIKMKQKNPITTPETPLEVINFATTGQGIATNSDGKKIFLWNALPGEKVTEYQILKQKSHLTEAVALKFETPNPHRVLPRDEHFLSNSPWQILDINYENSVKKQIIEELFSKLKTPEITFEASDNEYFYRNKMEYSLYYDHETAKIHAAIHRRGSHHKIPILTSSLENPAIYRRAMEIINELNSRQEDSRKYQSLLLHCNRQGEVSGGLYENYQPHPTFENLTDEILGQKFSYSPNGFFQINLPEYEKVLRKIKDFIKDQNKVIDLYSGVGTIGLTVASDKNLTLVEVDKFAHSELLNNIETVKSSTGNSNITGILAKSETIYNHITHDSTVIVDPPRSGCDTTLIETIKQKLPEKLVYLSCNPITQVRDLDSLLDYYKIKSVTGYNFFPHTPHIECLVLLDR